HCPSLALSAFAALPLTPSSALMGIFSPPGRRDMRRAQRNAERTAEFLFHIGIRRFSAAAKVLTPAALHGTCRADKSHAIGAVRCQLSQTI
ncbi:hypothetical protein ACCT19_38710, partial [Rhizobium ruizarguesonis]